VNPPREKKAKSSLPNQEGREKKLAPKEKKPKKMPKAANGPAAAHPSYLLMVKEAIGSLKERTGSSQYAIAKYLEQVYKAGLPPNFKKILSNQLRNMTKQGKVYKIKNSFKLQNDVESKAPNKHVVVAARDKSRVKDIKVPLKPTKVAAKKPPPATRLKKTKSAAKAPRDPPKAPKLSKAAVKPPPPRKKAQAVATRTTKKAEEEFKAAAAPANNKAAASPVKKAAAAAVRKKSSSTAKKVVTPGKKLVSKSVKTAAKPKVSTRAAAATASRTSRSGVAPPPPAKKARK
jgi:histone H1/5